MPPDLAVLIRCRNEERNISSLLESLCEQKGPTFEVIVCDNGSSDRTCDVVRSFSSRLTLRLLEMPNRALFGMKVAGARSATAPTIVLLDADQILGPRLLADIASKAAENKMLVIRERSFGDGLLSRIFSHEDRMYEEAGCALPRVMPTSFLRSVDTDGLEGVTMGEDVLRLILGREHGLEEGMTDELVYHKDQTRLVRLFEKYVFYGATLRENPLEGDFYAHNAWPQLKLVGRHLVRHPLLTLGVIGIKVLKAAGMMWGRIRSR